MESVEPSGRRLRLAGGLFLLILFVFSGYLALNRIYQVDEAQNIFTARILASHWASSHNLWIEIWHVWPLAWLAGRAQSSADLYHASRLFMLAVFWVNIALTALNCRVPLRSGKFLLALLGAATLAPLWDYGFEVRHDNLLLTCLLLFLYCLRTGPPRRPWLLPFCLGVLGATLQFVTFKSLVYWVPVAALLLAFPPSWGASRTRIFLAGCAGFASASVFFLGILALRGALPPFVDGLRLMLGLSAQPAERFSPWGTLGRLVRETPLLIGVTAAAIAQVFAGLRKGGAPRSFLEGLLPEASLTLVAVLALLIHPFPLPYHLCLLVPFAYILGFRWVCEGWERSPGSFKFLWAGLLVCTHGLPFFTATWRHLDFPNDRQERLMALAEQMTDPATDQVYDAAGLVASRQSIGRQWFLHTTFLGSYLNGEMPPVRQMLQERPAAVLIPNYRFTWLVPEDVDYIRAHYISLSPDYWVLGQRAQTKDLAFTCLHPGRYEIRAAGAGPAALLLDGQRVPAVSAQYLPRGTHHIASDSETDLQVAWLGPTLRQIPSLPPEAAEKVFINWY